MDYARIFSVDLSNAFDKVRHSLIISTLTEDEELDPAVVDWCANFPSCRQQRVSLNGKLSSWRSVNLGVPQGTVHGPIFFNCTTNKLLIPPHLTGRNFLLKFADDKYIICFGNSSADDSDLVLPYIPQWYEKNGLLVNSSKSKEMVVYLRSRMDY